MFSSKKFIPYIISFSFFMESLDATILNTAIPVMAHSLNVHPVNLKIALITYLLSLAIFIPISGWLADKFGIKKIFIGAIIVFTLSSFFCGLSKNIFELSIARFIQGFGGSLSLPVGRLIILKCFGRHNLVNVMGHVVMVGALGIMLGPILGGFITHYLSWQWIFWINIPVGIFAVGLSYFILPKFSVEKVPPLDKLGFIFFGFALSCFTLGLSALSESNINSYYALAILLASIILFFAYIGHSRNQPHPIVNINLFKERIFQVSTLGNLLSRLTFGGIPFLAPLLLQIGFGYPPQVSGILLSPIAIGVVLAKPLSLPALRLLGFKWLLILNTIFAGILLWFFTILTIHSPYYVIATIMFAYGTVISLQYSALNSLGYSEISPEDLSDAASIVSTCQQLAQSFGVAICALLLRIFSYFTFKNFNLTIAIFHEVFFILGILLLLSALIFIRLKPLDGYEIYAPD